MPRFCVVSYDDDEQQAFWDLVTAESESAAMQIVATARDYAVPVDALDADELYRVSARLAGPANDPPSSAQALRRVLKFECGATEFDDYFCRECAADYDGYGDGYDGLCPECADKAEKAGKFK